MRFGKLIALTAMVGGAFACAADVADIDRTQSDKIHKSIFCGDNWANTCESKEWYFRPTVVEVDYNQGWLFEGLEGDMDRIKWDLQKDILIAYRSYELLEGAERRLGEDGDDFYGSVVAAFPVVSHFDIIRQYNEATGEQSNVLVEDTVQRPWYERDYVRVNWSMNIANNPYNLESFFTAVSGAGHYQNQDNEPDNPYRPEITDTNINIIGSYQLESDWWSCYWEFGDAAFCGDSEALMKLSFKRVPSTVDNYEPLYYPDRLAITDAGGNPVQRCFTDGSCERESLEVFERFGFFRHERRAYDEEYIWTRDGRIFLGHRWNIWRKSRDGGETIPPEFRQPKPIVYYTNVDFPDYDGPATYQEFRADPVGWNEASIWIQSLKIAADWDETLRETVAELKRPVQPGLTADQIQPMFILKKNDCNIDNVTDYAAANGHSDYLASHGITTVAKGNLRRACALLEYASEGAFTWQKFGDLRHAFFNWVDTPQMAGPLGYGPSSADPITGEIVSATANIYGAAVDSFAAYAADIIALMNGVITLDEVADGTNIRDHIEAVGRRTARPIDHNEFEAHSRRQFEHRHEAFGDRVPNARRNLYNQKMMSNEVATLDELNGERAQNVEMKRGDLDRVIGTQFEKELLINDEMKRAMLGPEGYQPGAGISANVDDFSPTEFMLDDVAQKRRDVRMNFARHSIMMADLSDWSDAGIARLALDLQGKTWQEIYAFMRAEIYRGVQAHEVGHTVGLRHNFSGSYDALNYVPAFWESYNPATSQVERVATAGHPQFAAGEPTRAEQNMYSSIMDYDARFYADSFQGIGPYDDAAVKFGYGGLVETFKPGVAALGFESFTFLHDYHSFPKMMSGQLSCASEQTCHPDFLTANDYYSSYLDLDAEAQQAQADGDDALWQQKRSEADQAFENYQRFLNSYYKDALDNVTGVVNNIWEREYITLTDLKDRWASYYAGGRFNIPDVVPYEFCPDERAGYSIVDCQAYDKGATYREVTQDRMERYDAYYFFSNFKRDRWSFNDGAYINSYLGRLYSRYFSPMSMVFRYSLYSQSNMGLDKDGNELTLADFPVGRDWQAAGWEGLNFLSQIVEQPEPGEYCRNDDTKYDLMNAGDTCATAQMDYCLDANSVFQQMNPMDVCATQQRSYCSRIEQVYRPLESGDTCATGDTMDVGLGVGKHYFTNWTDEYFYKATRLGVFWDKYAALFAITDNEGFFYRDFASYFDVGAFQLSYWSGDLKDEMMEIFRGAYNGGTGKFAWRFDASRQGADRFVPAPTIDIYQDFDSASDYDLPKIESSNTYTLRYYGVLYPMARFNSTFDYSTDFSNYSRICLEGYLDCMDFNTAREQYTDPLTGYNYIASWTDRPSDTIAANMLKEAREFSETEYLPALTRVEETRDAMTGETLPTFPLNPQEAAEQASGKTYDDIARDRELHLEMVEREVNAQTSFIDVVRQIGGLVAGAY